MAELRFSTIDVDAHRELSREFERDTHMQSFGNLERMIEPEEFIQAWLRGLIDKDPLSCVHAWLGDRIVGELRMTLQRAAGEGYLFFVYLVPDQRGSGLADQLHTYAIDYFRARQVRRVMLSASPNNARALAFYARHGWRDLGPRPDAPHVNLHELLLSPPSRSRG